jgi:UDP-N-acetylglucosamine--N-acetylmuramyl-(pentapeptide) pyrophosphoryl-undecaprenol N-acetylglucosamine transferase
VDKVFSVGGYSSAPASFAAIMTGARLYIHEQNACMGRLNRILSRFATEVFSSYDERSKVRDYPAGSEWFALRRERRSLKSVAFLGGSQGAKFINDLAMECAPWMSEHGMCIVHQAGEKECEKVRKFYDERGIKADVFGFEPHLASRLAKVDFVVARSGAGTMWELAAAGIPALFIPFPYAASDHQYHNAKILQAKGAAYLIRQRDMDEKELQHILCSADTSAMSKALTDLIKPGGADEIVRAIEGAK